jgi:hypothetical protein
MKKTVCAGLLLAMALPLLAQTGGEQFDLAGGDDYNGPGSTLRFALDDMALRVSGRASDAARGGGGYVIEARQNLEFSGSRRLTVRVSGIGGADTFDALKLLKLELDNKPQATMTPRMRNRNDPTYINARNGDAVFDISGLRDIRKIDLVFFNCAITNLKIEIFYE